MDAPPLLIGALQETMALRLPLITVTCLGAPGAVVDSLGAVGVTDALADEADELPFVLVATTVKV